MLNQSSRRDESVRVSLPQHSSSSSTDTSAQAGFTSAPISAPSVSQSEPRPEFIRLPKPGQRDPYFSLSRSYWNLLLLPCAINGFKPPIKSISLRRPGTKYGVRLVSFASALAYFRNLEQVSDTASVLADEVAS